jgi:hypothetical protein
MPSKTTRKEPLMDKVVVVNDQFIEEVDEIILKHPHVVKSWVEAVQMAQALRTVSQLKKKNEHN